MEGLTIGYDAKRAAVNSTGLGNYSRYVIDTMTIGFPSNRYILYSPCEPRSERIEPLLTRANVELAVASGAGRRFGALWRSFGITGRLRADGVDVYHGLSNELPLNIKSSGIPSVVTIHDLIYRRVPEDYRAIDRRIYDYKYGRSAAAATRVIAISETTRRDLISDYQIDPAKIDVIYQGVDPRFSIAVSYEDKERVRNTYKLPRDFFVTVGTVSARKNQLMAVEAMRRLPADLNLVIVGSMRSEYADKVRRAVTDYGLTDRVMYLEGVPLADLPALYAMAKFSSYTSRYEGFGLPVVESLSTGTPVIAATGSCLEEAGGPGAVYVNPDDCDAFVKAADDILSNSVYADKLSQRGKAYVKRFSADEFARLTMAAYRKAIIDKLF